MTQPRTRPSMFVLIALFMFGLVTGRAQTDSEKRAAAVLFDRFETVAYARTDLSKDSTPNGQSYGDSEDNLKLPFLELIGAIRTLGPIAARDLKSRYSSVLVGAKDFVLPAGIGAMESRKCYIGILEDGAQTDDELDFRGVDSETIEGRQAWIWTVPSGDEESAPNTYFAARLEGPYLLVTNNRQDFEEVAKALTSVESSKPVSTTVFSWETLGAHQYWVCRSFRRTGVISPEASGIAHLGPSVTAIAFLADVDRRQGYIRVLTSDSSMKTVPKVLPDAELNLLQPDGPGTWRATIHLTKDASGYKTLFQIFYSFGFGAIL